MANKIEQTAVEATDALGRDLVNIVFDMPAGVVFILGALAAHAEHLLDMSEDDLARVRKNNPLIDNWRSIAPEILEAVEGVRRKSNEMFAEAAQAEAAQPETTKH